MNFNPVKLQMNVRRHYTFCLCRLIIWLANKLSILHKIKLVAGIKLSWAQRAGEALQMIDVLLCSSHYLRGRNTEITRCTLRSVAPVRPAKLEEKVETTWLFNISIWGMKSIGELKRLLPVEMKFVLATHLKKSSLQNNWPFRIKHFSLSWAWQSLHCRHFACHVRSDTLRMNRSKMNSWQPPHLGIVAGGKWMIDYYRFFKLLSIIIFVHFAVGV